MADDDHLTPLQRQQVEQVERMLNDPSLAAALANAGRLQLAPIIHGVEMARGI